MNQTNPFTHNPLSGGKTKKGPQYKNFLEAFQDIGKSSIKSSAKDTVDKLTKTNQQYQKDTDKQSFDFQQYLTQQEKRVRQQERTRFETIRNEEKVIFSREKKRVQVLIENIQVQIQSMAKEQVGLMEEIDQASFQSTVNPGIYHQNFFERLLQLIKLARKKVSESRSWMSLHNQRVKKQTHFWGQVRKSGTSFMLSGERTLATQTG